MTQPTTKSPAADQLFKCELCLRDFRVTSSQLFDGSNLELVKLSISELTRAFQENRQDFGQCGRADCAEVTAANAQRDQTRLQFRLQRRQQRREAEQSANRHTSGRRNSCAVTPKIDSNAPQRTYARPYAADTDFIDQPATQAQSDLSHSAEQARFIAEGDGAKQCEKMLELLWEGFNPDDPTRTSRGVWISSADLAAKHQIPRANSRASQLRGCESYEPHPLVKKHRLDIDSIVLDKQWGYQICFIENSQRLARDRQKQNDGHQQEFCG